MKKYLSVSTLALLLGLGFVPAAAHAADSSRAYEAGGAAAVNTVDTATTDATSGGYDLQNESRSERGYSYGYGDGKQGRGKGGHEKDGGKYSDGPKDGKYSHASYRYGDESAGSDKSRNWGDGKDKGGSHDRKGEKYSHNSDKDYGSKKGNDSHDSGKDYSSNEGGYGHDSKGGSHESGKGDYAKGEGSYGSDRKRHDSGKKYSSNEGNYGHGSEGAHGSKGSKEGRYFRPSKADGRDSGGKNHSYGSKGRYSEGSQGSHDSKDGGGSYAHASYGNHDSGGWRDSNRGNKGSKHHFKRGDSKGHHSFKRASYHKGGFKHHAFKHNRSYKHRSFKHSSFRHSAFKHRAVSRGMSHKGGHVAKMGGKRR
ncbi:MAG: hypothetical protein AB7H77_02640 [Bdellovibrionales bacterium]